MSNEIHAIILARGGSKGIPSKNIINFLGKPLLAWSIEQCLNSSMISDVWVSSDDKEILNIAKQYGAKIINRPDNLSDDFASSESGWLHAMEFIKKQNLSIEYIFAPQVTSPLREVSDIDKSIKLFLKDELDSMFSASLADDLFFWTNANNIMKSVNYDYRNRKRRQDIDPQIIENGSFYIFKPEIIQKHNNRFGGKIGYSKMDFWKMFEIDSLEDLKICSVLMQEFLLNN